MMRMMREGSAVTSLDVDFGSERVLVVDDDDAVLHYATRTLQGRGHPVSAHVDAEEAWAEACGGECAVAVVDLHMPGRDGRWLLDRLASGAEDTAVIMLTGDADLQVALECLEQGAVRYLTKPVAPQDLVHAVTQALENRRIRLENRAHRERLEELVRERTAGLEEVTWALQESQQEAIYRLSAAAEYRDEETGLHIVRMARYAAVIAEELKLDQEFVRQLLLAAPMHDVGKIGISDAILQKPGKLTPEEFEVMQAHTLIGARLLARSTSPLMQMAERIALTHHEWWDGSGYPHGLRDTQIPLEGRIAAVADVLDALTSTRVYRPALTVDAALAMIAFEKGTHFDPDVVGALFCRLDEILRILTHYGPDGRGTDHIATTKHERPGTLHAQFSRVTTAGL
ncbi:MAG: HD-GYP domain-containing protein [Thermoleophilia bacterium]